VAGFDTKSLPVDPDVVAPDGSNVRVLLALAGGSMAHFELAPGLVSIPVAHRTVEEVWYIVGGRGEMWRREGQHTETVTLLPGVCVTIPVGTAFQFKSDGPEPLTAIAITMPPWPGESEAYEVEGAWQPQLGDA
jgi:mannose-6-phosphate isomerase-like protein (cupin superfamily)